jgi:DUF4097 and DUF4098 domain-containing protein YvlB
MLGWMTLVSHFSSMGQEFKEHGSKEFTPSGAHPVLVVYNINGHIRVTGYSGNKVIIETDKTIRAKNAADLETGKGEFRFELEQSGDTIEAYVSQPEDSRPHDHWHNDWHRIKYYYNLDFTIKVPFGMNLSLSTVNDGNINVSDVTGLLDLSNVNGSILVSGAKETTDAHTVNGDITVTYTAVPSDASSYNTINGNLKVTYPSSLSADLEFKSLNGSFYTDFNDVEMLPFKVIKNDEKDSEGTTYKLDKNSNFRFGKGGKVFKFETLNGNVYIKKQS